MLKEVKVVFIDELKESFKNRRILFPIFVLILTAMLMRGGGSLLVALYVIFKPANMLPHTILLPFYLCYLILPLIVIFISYDSIAEETQKNHIRYLASKISRSSIFLGKFLSNFALSSLFIIILFVYASFNLASSSRVVPFQEISSVVLQLIIFVTSIISLTMLCSTIAKTTHGALKLSSVLWTVLAILSVKSNIKPFLIASYYPQILKFSFMPSLVFIIYTIIGIILSLYILERKDL